MHVTVDDFWAADRPIIFRITMIKNRLMAFEMIRPHRMLRAKIRTLPVLIKGEKPKKEGNVLQATLWKAQELCVIPVEESV